VHTNLARKSDEETYGLVQVLKSTHQDCPICNGRLEMVFLPAQKVQVSCKGCDLTVVLDAPVPSKVMKGKEKKKTKLDKLKGESKFSHRVVQAITTTALRKLIASDPKVLFLPRADSRFVKPILGCVLSVQTLSGWKVIDKSDFRYFRLSDVAKKMGLNKKKVLEMVSNLSSMLTEQEKYELVCSYCKKKTDKTWLRAVLPELLAAPEALLRPKVPIHEVRLDTKVIPPTLVARRFCRTTTKISSIRRATELSALSKLLGFTNHEQVIVFIQELSCGETEKVFDKWKVPSYLSGSLPGYLPKMVRAEYRRIFLSHRFVF